MTDKLSKPTDDQLSKGIKLGTKQSGLHSRVRKAAESPGGLEQADMPNRIALMLDDSSSMLSAADDSALYPAAGVKTKMSHLKDAVEGFLQACDPSNTSVSMNFFNERKGMGQTTQFAFLQMEIFDVEASGSTPMAQCMEGVIGNESITRGVMVSDGRADNEDFVHSVAARFKEATVPIDCLHIGKSTEGEELLKYVAELTGGKYIKFKDVATFAKSLLYLTPRYRALLDSGDAKTLLGADEVT